MNSRIMPILLSRNLTTPLSVNVDNQMIPQCANADNVVSLPDHLSPDTRKHLIGPFTGGGGDGGGTTVSPTTISPTTSAMVSFDGFDYDGSAASLLQIGPDLLGGLLDRNLVWFSASEDDSNGPGFFRHSREASRIRFPVSFVQYFATIFAIDIFKSLLESIFFFQLITNARCVASQSKAALRFTDWKMSAFFQIFLKIIWKMFLP